ncbi:MAG: hypothetical protein V2A74_13600, partial [bacterium]
MKRLLCAFLLVMFLLLFCSKTAGAAELRVPADYPTIQSAIDAAHDNIDRLLITPGVYYETLLVDNKIVEMESTSPTAVVELRTTATAAVTVRNGAAVGLQRFYVADSAVLCSDAAALWLFECRFIRNNVGGPALGCSETTSVVIYNTQLRGGNGASGGIGYYWPPSGWPGSPALSLSNCSDVTLVDTTLRGGIGGAGGWAYVPPFYIPMQGEGGDGGSGLSASSTGIPCRIRATRVRLTPGTGGFGHPGGDYGRAKYLSGPVTYETSDTRTLVVRSANPSAGVPISVTPADRNGQSAGVSPFKCVYTYEGDFETKIQLTAPQGFQGIAFTQWVFATPAGLFCSPQPSYTVTLDDDSTATAIYASPSPGAPVIDNIPDTSPVSPLSPYVGLVPNLLQGSPPITWSLVAGPPGMTIKEALGVVSWSFPTPDSSHNVTIRAANSKGSDDENWIVTVNPLPPPNDDASSPSLIGSASGTTTGTNRGATRESYEGAHAGYWAHYSVWWLWTS